MALGDDLFRPFEDLQPDWRLIANAEQEVEAAGQRLNYGSLQNALAGDGRSQAERDLFPFASSTDDFIQSLSGRRAARSQRGYSNMDAMLGRVPMAQDYGEQNYGGQYARGENFTTSSAETRAILREEWTNLGWTEDEIEAAFLNIQDESGFNTGITESSPNVHGTRGQGLFQLTDPRPGQGRRTDYLNFVAANNLTPWDAVSQARFADWERRGPERASWAKIDAAQDRWAKAAAMVQYNLRPAAQHMQERVARYQSMRPY